MRLTFLLVWSLAASLTASAGFAQTPQCSLDGSALGAGQAQMFYSARSVARGQDCDAVGQLRHCADGGLDGTTAFRYARCTQLEGFLGVNTNRKPGNLDADLLVRSGADWIRTNVEILEYEEQAKTGKTDPNWDFTDWKVYIDAAAGDERKAILNLMWNFEKFGQRPPKPGSKREAELLAFLDLYILDTLAPHVDILTTGNEPFINTEPADWAYDPAYGGAPIVVFYERVTEHVHAYLIDRGLRDRVDLYVGAFTGLHTKKMQEQPAVRDLLAYAETTGFVDGVDMHTHVVNLKQIDRALTFVRGATTKPIIVTEFTYVWGMKQAVADGDRLGPEFARRWGRDPKQKIGDYMACEAFGVAKGCKKNGPVSKAEWDDFFMTRDWYIDHFILETDALFREHGVRGATFGLAQTLPTRDQFSPERPPWYMGFLFVGVAVEPGPDGKPQTNYQYFDDFMAIQRQRAGVPLH